MKLTKEQLEYELVIKHLELRDGVLWRKEFVDSRGRVFKARPENTRMIEDNGYQRLRVGRKKLFIHRVNFILYHNKPIREGYQIHHENHDKLDNRIDNLKEVSCRENNQNLRVHADGKLVGVSYDKRNGTYQASIRINRKFFHLGMFKTDKEGHQVYLLAVEEVETYGHLVRSRAERAAAAGVVPCTRGSRLRNTEQRGEFEALEYYQLRVE